ncbi:MAG: type IV pilus secretin PilQ [Burkholderiales bacterium]|nr:MAG: type IV pilus secretin PilQ [Burkholderiales bacterium]
MLLAKDGWAQAPSIQSITSSVSAGDTIVRIRLSGPAREPNAFSINNPPRIALDLPGTENASGRSRYEFTQGEVRNIAVVQTGDRARVVLNLRRQASYETRIEGNTLLVELKPVSTAAEAPASETYRFAAADASTAHSLLDIDFRRGVEGEGRVVIEMSDSQAGVDVRQQGNQVVVDFLKTNLPENLRRLLDVSDFGTPVRTVRAEQQGANTRLIIEPAGLWEHNAYQSENQFVVEVKAIEPDPNKLFQGTRIGYRGEKLSLNFQNVDIRALLQVIADFTNLNIVTSDSVEGTVTLRLKDVPWDQALDIVLQAKDLDMRKNGNVLLIAPRDELATKEKLELEARQEREELEPLRSESFQLNYQKAEAIAKLLTDDKQRVLSKRGSAVFDARSNKLFVQDTTARLEEVRKLVAQTDIAVRQVLIEARIVEADDRFSRNLGVRLGFNDLRSTVYRTVAVPDPSTGALTNVNLPVYGAGRNIAGSGVYGTISGSLQGVADLSSQLGSDVANGFGSAVGLGRPTAVTNTNFVNLPAAAISGANPATFAISLFGAGLTQFLNLELSALEADQRGKVVSSPRVLTADQTKATIEQGTEIPYQKDAGDGGISIVFRKATLRLEVTPQITPEGNVILDVQVNRDSVGVETRFGPAIDTRNVQTQVLVENGGTVVIGGIYEQIERNTVNKVPVLGDIPIVGNAFKNKARVNDRTELLVFLTPRVVSEVATAR